MEFDKLDARQRLDEGSSDGASSPDGFDEAAARPLLRFGWFLSDFCCCRKFFITVWRMIFWFLRFSALEGTFTLTVVTNWSWNCAGRFPWETETEPEPEVGLELAGASASSSSMLIAFLCHRSKAGVSSAKINSRGRFRGGDIILPYVVAVSLLCGWGLKTSMIGDLHVLQSQARQEGGNGGGTQPPLHCARVISASLRKPVSIWASGHWSL